jgi:hypothetical protein
MALYTFAPHAPKTPEHVEDVVELESCLNRLVDSGSPPGLSLVVVKDGGVADGPGGRKTDTEAVYHWGQYNNPLETSLQTMLDMYSLPM